MVLSLRVSHNPMAASSSTQHDLLEKFTEKVINALQPIQSALVFLAANHSTISTPNPSSVNLNHKLDLRTTDKQYQMEFPRFGGGDPSEWLYQTEKYFRFHNISETQKLVFASLHLDGAASSWFQWMEMTNQVHSWMDFVIALTKQFGPYSYADPIESLPRLVPKSSVQEYQLDFQNLCCRNVNNKYFKGKSVLDPCEDENDIDDDNESKGDDYVQRGESSKSPSEVNLSGEDHYELVTLDKNQHREVEREQLQVLGHGESSDFTMTNDGKRKLISAVEDVEVSGLEEEPEWLRVKKRSLLHESSDELKPNVMVAKDGSGDFKTINDALQCIFQHGKDTLVLKVKEDVYEEQVVFIKEMSHGFLLGDGHTKTKITGSLSYGDGIDTPETATVSVDFLTNVDSTSIVLASIAQDHGARLQGFQKEVAIKVFKPGIDDTLVMDMNPVYLAARILEFLNLDELGVFIPYVGRVDHAHVLFPPLETLCTVEAMCVKDKAMESLCRIGSQMQESDLVDWFIPLVKRFTVGDWFPARVSAYELFHISYPCASEIAKTKLRSIYHQLCQNDMPMQNMVFHKGRDIFWLLCKDMVTKSHILKALLSGDVVIFHKWKNRVELRDAQLDTSTVHDVVLVGGSPRIPRVQQLLQNFFQWFYPVGELCGFSQFPTIGIKAWRQSFYFDFSVTYVGTEMICSHLLNFPLLLGVVLSWSIMWPLISGLKGNWFPRSLPETSMQSLTGYKVFISISLIVGSGFQVKTNIGHKDFSIDGVLLSEGDDLDGNYKKFMESRITSVNKGGKCTIMMYGPTGSGKSHTMFGCPKQPGIVYKSLKDILGKEEIAVLQGKLEFMEENGLSVTDYGQLQKIVHHEDMVSLEGWSNDTTQPEEKLSNLVINEGRPKRQAKQPHGMKDYDLSKNNSRRNQGNGKKEGGDKSGRGC